MSIYESVAVCYTFTHFDPSLNVTISIYGLNLSHSVNCAEQLLYPDQFQNFTNDWFCDSANKSLYQKVDFLNFDKEPADNYETGNGTHTNGTKKNGASAYMINIIYFMFLYLFSYFVNGRKYTI